MNLNVFTDGASRKNPGHSGAGIYIEDEDGNKISELSRYLGIKTNNEAEYMALIIALRFITDNIKGSTLLLDSVIFYTPIDFKNIENVVVNCDSQLLVMQMNGKYKVKSSNIIPLYNEAKGILKNFKNPSFSFNYIPREYNRDADRLANLAIDGHLVL